VSGSLQRLQEHTIELVQAVDRLDRERARLEQVSLHATQASPGDAAVHVNAVHIYERVLSIAKPIAAIMGTVVELAQKYRRWLP
jgi:hypothetical protein